MRRLIPAALVLGLTLPAPGNAQEASSALVLQQLWTVDGALLDANADGFADAARLQLEAADPASAPQAAALANLAARLGFETMAMDLPIPAAAGGIRVSVGSAPAGGAPWVSLLEEGRGSGFVAVDPMDPRHVYLWGVDDAGLAGATNWLAGRAPYLWAATGPDLDAGLEIATGWITQNLPGARVEFAAIRVPADRPGVDLVFRSASATTAAPLPEDTVGPEIEGVGNLYLLDDTGSEARRIPSSSAAAEAGGKLADRTRKTLDLAAFYSTSGVLGDGNDDAIPDRQDVVLSTTAAGNGNVVTLAARLGLEAAGLRVPLVVTPDALGEAELGTRVLIGSDHPLLAKLADAAVLPAEDQAPGEGRIDVLRDAFDEDVAAIAVRGVDDGAAAATDYLALTAPYISDRGKGHPTLDDLTHAVRRFLSRRTAAGQAAAALDVARERLSVVPSTARDVTVRVAVDHAPAGLDSYVERQLGALVAGTSVEVTERSVRDAPVVWQREADLVPETEQLRRALTPLMEAGVAGESVTVEARISEPRAIRDQVAAELLEDLLARGASAATVQILPAYKQGFGWIEEVLLPRLAGAGVEDLTIYYKRNDPPEEWPYQAMNTPSRWLLELFPIDEIAARELGLPLDAIRFVESAPGESATYVVEAKRGDAVILREAYDPAIVVRPYFQMFPNYERVRITTGWVRAEIDGRRLVDAQLPTDLERVWDIYQQDVLPALHDYTMRLHEGVPRPGYAPHFGELVAEIALSEPERSLGVDQERIAPMEALHEEIYFGTLHFFDLMGRIATGSPLPYPGRVIPIVRPRQDGAAGTVSFRFSGFATPLPRVDVDYMTDAGPVRWRRDLPPADVDRPTIHGLTVRPDRTLREARVWTGVDAHTENRDELVRAYSHRQLDSSWITSARLSGALRELEGMQTAGLYTAELAYRDLDSLEVTLGAGFKPDAGEDIVVRFAAHGVAAPPPDPQALLAADPTHRVQWDTPMPPGEAHGVLAAMAAEFDTATIYRLGSSYLGAEIWGLDLMAPLPGTHWSQAKATALKPTVVYSARQHANEVSSTSHVLRLAELLLTDPQWSTALQRLNVVIHPVTNPDGAQLAYDLHQITPDHMLHAGYLGSLGVDVTAGAGDADPVYPESSIRDALWEAWLPDIFLNPHGYPSHEWVQPFSEYAGWVRHRTTQSRDWWGMRGWFMPGFAFLDDPEYPRHREHALLLRDYITAGINALPDIVALNERAYGRYRRYGQAADPEAFKMNFSDDVLIYTSLEGQRAGGRGYATRNPKVTIWSGTTEAPDETASGDWLQLVASAGLAWDQAILRYLLDLEHPVERSHEGYANGATISLLRERPGKRPGSDE